MKKTKGKKNWNQDTNIVKETPQGLSKAWDIVKNERERGIGTNMEEIDHFLDIVDNMEHLY